MPKKVTFRRCKGNGALEFVGPCGCVLGYYPDVIGQNRHQEVGCARYEGSDCQESWTVQDLRDSLNRMVEKTVDE